MATGGRVVHHLANMLPGSKNTVILVGYQAVGSRGRQLDDGATELKIHGNLIPVNAHITNVESFSVHADSDELVTWLKMVKKPKKAYVVHGEVEGQEHLKERLTNELGWDVVIPKSNQSFSV
jgi:metallo-beta-lactamase family protein